MRFTLKDFQEEAVSQLLENLSSARLVYSAQHRPCSISLTAATGAGKTVMAAAVIESLFYGSEQFSFSADPNAVVLWVTDDPSLNEQTKWRFVEASDCIEFPRLEIIKEGFDQEEFDPMKVYFLNRQKLSVSSNLTKHRDTRNYTIWQTINNTIINPEIHLYMIIDEAHRGIRAERRGEAAEKKTIYAQLIDGHDGGAPMPIVLGISATISRFSDAMASRARMQIGNVAVDPNDVQASGLLKDTITLQIPGEAGSFDAALLREACSALVESEQQWAEYCGQQDVEDVVKPLMVVQVPNLVSDDELFELCEQISESIPALSGRDSFGHVLGDREEIILGVGKYFVRHIYPQNVQETASIRILFAKEAISTGWDCPRAEVLFSLRSGQDKTYITQLIGRMVRTPLARRIEGNDVLSSVACFLPKFNRQTTYEVAKYLTGDLTDDTVSAMPNRRVLTSPVTLLWDKSLGDDVKQVFAKLPTKLIPRVAGNQIDRLLDIAGKLAAYGVNDEADIMAKDYVCRLIDSQRILYADQYQAALEEVYTAHTHTTVASRESGEVSEVVGAVAADKSIIEAGYSDACRLLTHEMSKYYLKKIITAQGNNRNYLAAKAEVAAVVLVKEICDELDSSCSDYADQLFNDHRDAIYGLSDEARAAFDEVQRRSLEPQDSRIVVPESLKVNSEVQEGDLISPLPQYEKSVLSLPDTHLAPFDLNNWEQVVLQYELETVSTVAWYRNPSGPSKAALQIPYRIGDKWRAMQPDFVFFSRMADGSIMPSIVDPHGTDWADAIPKLEGMAAHAKEFGDKYKRIEQVAYIDGEYKFIDFMKEENVDAVLSGRFDNCAQAYRELGSTYASTVML